MSTLKKVYWKKGIALKKQQSADKFSLSPWNSGLLAAISARANNETFCTKVRKFEFSELGSLRCSHTPRCPTVWIRKSSLFLLEMTCFSSLLVKNPYEIQPKIDKSLNLLLLRYVLRNWFGRNWTHQKNPAGNAIKNIQDITLYKYYTKTRIRNNQGK